MAGGRPSIDPAVFFKLQLILFFEGLPSERHLMRVAADRLSLRWYLGYNLTEPLPDHSSPTRIRERFGLPVFRRFFEVITELCLAAGLVWGKNCTSRPRWYQAPPLVVFTRSDTGGEFPIVGWGCAAQGR